jgi:hypothetical protein
MELDAVVTACEVLLRGLFSHAARILGLPTLGDKGHPHKKRAVDNSPAWGDTGTVVLAG